MLECGTCIITSPTVALTNTDETTLESKVTLFQRMKRILEDVEVQAK